MNTRIIISALMLALVCGVGNAMIQVDTSSDALFFCDYGTKFLSFNITNSFDELVTVSIGKAGSITNFADVHFFSEGLMGSILDVELLPGEVRTVNAVVTLNREVEYGEKELLLSFDWGSSIVKSIKVFVDNCHTVLATADSVSKSSCLLTPIEYVISIINSGLYDETLSFELVGEGVDYARVSADSLNIKNGESKNVYVFFYPTTEAGNFTSVLNIFNNKIFESITLDSIINKCADYSVTLEESVQTCEGGTVEINVTVLNTGLVADKYDLVVDSPVKTSVSHSKLSLDVGEFGTSVLKFLSECDDVGVFNTSLKIRSEEALHDFETFISTEVSDCYDFDFFTSLPHDLCVCETGSYNFSLVNNGVFEQEYVLSHTDNDFSIKESKVIVPAGGEVIIPSSFFSCDEGFRDVRLGVVDNSVCRTKFEGSIRIPVLDEKACFAAKIITPESYELNELSQYNIPISIRNQGIRASNYSFSFSGSASSWVYAVSREDLLLDINEGNSLNALVIPPVSLNDNKYSLIVNVFAEGVLVASKAIAFSKPVFVHQVTQAPSDIDGSAFEYFMLALTVFTIIVIILNWDVLVSFLRNHLAKLINGKKKKRRKIKKKGSGRSG